ncbi:hypothetical protein [Acinetobacter baumannii]|uniref:hypothetical protein n=1 Tax=Acinetobacter baumannii TaxID=470 RepID=UPI0011207505|nr:hypothetical protein [Acinetobacter baumannii]MBD0229053.1 hypothetical protein [Acinetobacter baumannii]MBL4060747.1 hypothetical protein [Acinetobacter baumannii]MBP4148667.1 hypothetical protein [Acinetobacter baumannii]MBP4156231.1 hypothetical protein [Acinetobacter baumannii]MBP4167407.1 hypothetical protein [Acinetobacter baumannii]
MDQNSDTQDVVETTATENTSVESQETNSPGTETQEPETGEQQQDGEPETEPEKPKKSRAQERVEQALQRAFEAERKLKEYEAQKKAPQGDTKPVKPRIEDFETYEEYLKEHDAYEEKLDEWRISEAERRILEKQSKAQSEKSQTEKQVEMEGAIAAFAEQTPDFDDVVQKGIARQLPMPISLDELADEFGYDAATQTRLLYELAKDEELHQLVSDSSKLKAARILSERVDSWGSKPATPPVSKAPPPIKPVQANAPAVRDPSKMSDDEWYKAETQKRNKGK